MADARRVRVAINGYGVMAGKVFGMALNGDMASYRWGTGLSEPVIAGAVCHANRLEEQQ